MEREKITIPLYAVETPDGYIFIKDVPVSLDPVTEERLFSPEVVERMALIEQEAPKAYKMVPVYQF